ncbi:hypothetical protein ACWDA3_61650 [Nonomuraea rubra]
MLAEIHLRVLCELGPSSWQAVPNNLEWVIGARLAPYRWQHDCRHDS